MTWVVSFFILRRFGPRRGRCGVAARVASMAYSRPRRRDGVFTRPRRLDAVDAAA